jgi:hypothetical protein
MAIDSCSFENADNSHFELLPKISTIQHESPLRACRKRSFVTRSQADTWKACFAVPTLIAGRTRAPA